MIFQNDFQCVEFILIQSFSHLHLRSLSERMVKLWSCFPWVFWNLCSLSQLLPTSYLSSCWSDAPFYGSEWSEESFGGIYETLVPYLKVASITFLLTQDFLWDAFFLFFFHKMSQCGTFEVTLFSAISRWKWLDELRFSTASGAPWQHLMPESHPVGIGSPDHKKKHHEVGRSADAEPRPGEVYFVIFVPWFPFKKLLNFVISLDV